MKVAEHKNKSFRMLVKGKSMEPTIMENSNVIVESLHPDQVKIGDVVVFKTQKKMIVHKIIGIHKINRDLFFVEKGNDSPISIFHHENLLGRVSNGLEGKVVVEPYHKSFINIYLLFTYPVFKNCQIIRQLLRKRDKKLAEFFFYSFLELWRFFPALPSLSKRNN